jgi:hypothetical protein
MKVWREMLGSASGAPLVVSPERVKCSVRGVNAVVTCLEEVRIPPMPLSWAETCASNEGTRRSGEGKKDLGKVVHGLPEVTPYDRAVSHRGPDVFDCPESCRRHDWCVAK